MAVNAAVAGMEARDESHGEARPTHTRGTSLSETTASADSSLLIERGESPRRNLDSGRHLEESREKRVSPRRCGV